MYFVYILRCGDGTLYTGIARDVSVRVRQHAAGSGSKYVRARGVAAVVFTERKRTRSSALKREAQIKRMSRQQKEALVAVVAQW